MAKRLRLTPIKTPLHDDSLKVARAYQRLIQEAREYVDTMRPSTTIESPHITRFINSIPFIDALLEDGTTPVALKFICGRPHPETGLARYVVLSREQVRLFLDSEFANDHWRLDGTGKKAGDAEGFHVFLVQRIRRRTTAAAVLFALANPGVPFKGVSLRDRNSFALRPENLEATPPEERRKYKSTVPDLTPFYERINGITDDA